MMNFYQRFLPYIVAIGSTAIALILTLSLEPLLPRTLGAFFYIAIIVTAWYGGFRPGNVAVILSTLAINYWFIPPRYQFWTERPEDVFQIFIFLLVASLINFLTSKFRDSKQKIEQLSQKLAQENAAQLRMALQAAQMGMWDWNIVTGEINWSPEHERLFGLNTGTFDGKYQTFEARLHPDDLPKLNQALERSLRERIPYQHEYRVVWADGSIHWVEGRGQAFYDQAGQPIRMTGTIMAIDNRKQAEAALQERKAILRLFAQYAPAGIAMFDRDMRYVMASQRWVEEYKLDSVESLIGRSHYEIFPEMPERWRQIHQRCLAGASEKCDEDLFVRVDGTQQWISWEIHPWYTAIDEVGGIILFSIDVTGRKQAEIALLQVNAELEARVTERTAKLTEVNDRLLETVMEQQHTQLILLEQAQLLDLAHDTIITRDLNSVITFWNKGAEYMYGWKKVEALGQESHTFLQTQFPQPLAEIESELLEKGYWEGELIHTGKYGTSITVASRWVMQKDEMGRPIQLLEINNDITLQKQAQAALQQYVEEVEDLYNNAPCGYHSLDTAGNFIRINNTELNWLGYSRDEILHKSFLDLLTAESKQIFQENFLNFKDQGWINNLEFELVSKDGRTRWIALNATALKDDSGNFIMSRSTLFDISKRKRAEQMLQLQAVITRNMAEGICLVRAENGIIVYANPKFEQMFGYDAGELNGQHVSIINYATEAVTAEDVYQAIRSAIFQSGEATYEVHNIKKDGTPFWCKATCSVFKHPDYGDVLVAVHQDITITKQLEEVRQQAEAALRESEAKFRSLSESSPIGIFMTDAQGQYIYTNPRYQAICGCTFDELLGKGYQQFIHPEDREEMLAKWLTAISQKQEFRSEFRYARKDGIIRFSRVLSAPIFSVGDELIGYVGTVEDVTDSRAIETIKKEFISIVSHELRTPLASIRGSLGLLASGVLKNKPDTAQKMLEIAAHDTERLVRLVNDILDLERLEVQKVKLNLQWCDAAKLMQQSVETVQSLAVQSNITLSVEPTSVQVWADSDRITQTLVNLVSNAIKFSPKETTVTLSVQDQADRVLFQIKDQGRGIPADKLESIFGRFQQIDASDSRQKGGTGLGLAICKNIVQQHGGKIWVESVVGESSNFYFTLPKLLD